MNEFLEIDGSMLEGGGQILRIAVSLSAILNVPIRVSRIRAGRSKPGLAAQHLVGIKLMADMCGASLKGAHIGSMEITFVPGRKIRGGHYVADTRTAGSISLILQVALPGALMANGPVTLDIKGGTNADMAPQIDYFNHIFMKNLNKFGVDVDLIVHRRGYYPKGGGHVTVRVEPAQKFKGISLLDRGDFIKIFGWSFVAGTIPMKLAHQMVEGVREQILPVHDFVEIQAYKEDTKSAIDNCSGLIIGCETTSGCVLGADGLGRRGVDAMDLGRRAGAELLALMESGACLDTYAQDQIILYMALAEGKSTVRCGEITLHTRTAIHIAQMISKVQFTVQPEGDQNIISCTGLGYVNKHFDAAHWGPPPNATA